jgi:hypothetical protein
MTTAESAAVIGDLRRARRRQRVAAIHWVDALYQVYITALVAIVGVVFLSGYVGDDQVRGADLDRVVSAGPALLGTAVAFAVLIGLRSGSRGGPLALERADVRHVLLAPVDRGVALRGPAWRQLRFLVLVGAGIGATAGLLATRRLPEPTAAWLLAGALLGATVAALGFGAALVASGSGLPASVSTTVGLALVAWSVGDLADRLPTAPGSFVGRLGLAPLEADAVLLVGPVAALVVVAGGVALVAGTSLEAAERRTALVGQIRFAVTLQDLRTVLVLRRQLAQERPRARPWIAGSRGPARRPVLRRGVRSVARWPVGRLVRVVGFAVVAGLAWRGVWAGTTPLLVLAGLALWVAALDAVEPMGQEVDHPGRTDSYPLARGELLVGLLPVVLGVAALTGVLAAGAASVPVGAPVPVLPVLVVGVVAGLLAGCGAVVSTVQGAPDAVDLLAVSTPEIAGARTVVRTVWPPAMAVAGGLPLVLARGAERSTDGDPLVGAVLGAAPLLVVVGLVAGWVRFHDEIHAWFRDLMDQASPTKAMERAAAEREAAGEGAAVGDGEVDGGDAERETTEGRVTDDGPARDRGVSSGQRRPSKSRPAPPPPGVQGGTSAKPIGRKRDQR